MLPSKKLLSIKYFVFKAIFGSFFEYAQIAEVPACFYSTQNLAI